MKSYNINVLHINSYFQVGKFYKFLYDNEKEYCDIKVYIPVSIYNNEYDYGKYSIVSKCYNKYDRIIFYYKHSKIYKDILKKVNVKEYNLIHAHSLFSNGYIAYKLKKNFNIKYIVAVRNTDVNVFFKKMFFLRNLGRKILKNADGIIFLSDSYKENVIKKYMHNDKEIIDKSYVIPNGIDDFWIENKYLKKRKNNNNINLIYAGRIEKNKNILTTVKAAQILIDKGYNVSFKIIGTIKDKSYYDEIIKYSFVSWKDKLEKEKLIEEYRDSDIFVMPSIYETFGLVYAEAMSQSLPVIYSLGQGFDGQFKEGEVGYHVDKLNPNDIQDKILKIIENYDEISKRCYEKFTKFDWKKISKKYIDLYSKIVK